MPRTSSATVFIEQSGRLLQARPTTAKITYSYNVNAKTQRGTLSLKTYDPVSGACFRFRTMKINDLNRILRAVSNLAEVQAGTGSPISATAGALE
ncbi:signal recognition particle 9 kDa protein-domain-containing protein [Lipomyces japonicus]|uniref:signal recognition particle 9 kDa protein-domain-containing protein n=1 Tax=Lipomyces japonicus TaxID=56871 RepID=UPI0034CE2414